MLTACEPIRFESVGFIVSLVPDRVTKLGGDYNATVTALPSKSVIDGRS